MRLLQQASSRLRDNGHSYNDLFLVWEHNGEIYSVRVMPSFKREYKLLLAEAQHIPSGEMPEKYL